MYLLMNLFSDLSNCSFVTSKSICCIFISAILVHCVYYLPIDIYTSMYIFLYLHLYSYHGLIFSNLTLSFLSVSSLCLILFLVFVFSLSCLCLVFVFSFAFYLSCPFSIHMFKRFFFLLVLFLTPTYPIPSIQCMCLSIYSAISSSCFDEKSFKLPSLLSQNTLRTLFTKLIAMI